MNVYRVRAVQWDDQGYLVNRVPQVVFATDQEEAVKKYKDSSGRTDIEIQDIEHIAHVDIV